MRPEIPKNQPKCNKQTWFLVIFCTSYGFCTIEKCWNKFCIVSARYSFLLVTAVRQNADETEEKNDKEGESCHLSVAWLSSNFSFETIILPLWWWGRVWVTFETEEKNDDKEDESSHRCMTFDYVTSAVPTIFPFSPF